MVKTSKWNSHAEGTVSLRWPLPPPFLPPPWLSLQECGRGDKRLVLVLPWREVSAVKSRARLGDLGLSWHGKASTTLQAVPLCFWRCSHNVSSLVVLGYHFSFNNVKSAVSRWRSTGGYSLFVWLESLGFKQPGLLARADFLGVRNLLCVSLLTVRPFQAYISCLTSVSIDLM